MSLPNPITVTIPQNVGMSFEMIIVFLLFVGGIILMAKDFRLALLAYVLSFGVDIIVMYEYGFNYVPGIISLLMIIVMLAFTLYAGSNKAKSAAGYLT